MQITERKLENKNKRIIFSGPPGVGKTTLGRLFANKLNLDFFDLDDYVASILGLISSKEVIEIYGRDYFKEKESLYLKELLERQDKIVISIGGGTNSRIDCKYAFLNQAEIHKHGFNICILPSDNINEAVQILRARLDNKRRAMVTDLEGLYERWKIYTPILIEQADVVVYIHNNSPENIIDEIISKYF